MRGKTFGILASVIILASPLPSNAYPIKTLPRPDFQGSRAEDYGLDVVGADAIQPRVPMDVRESWDEAMDLAMGRPEDFGYPWIDTTSRTI